MRWIVLTVVGWCLLVGCRVRRTDDITPAVSVSARPMTVAPASAARSASPAPPPPPPPPPVEAPEGALVVAIGGVGSSATQSDVALLAVDAATQALVRGDSPSQAAALGVAVLEDDPGLLAGTGSNLRLNGIRVEMDAATMDSEGRFSAVGAIERVRNPVLVAADVAKSPHVVLVGSGALAFARRRGFAAFEPKLPIRVRERDARRKALAAMEDPVLLPFLVLRAEAGSGGGAPTSSGSSNPSGGGASHSADGGSAPPSTTSGGGSAAVAAGAGKGSPTASVDAGPPADAGMAGDAGTEDTDSALYDEQPEGAVAVLVRAADGRFAVAASSGGPRLALSGRIGELTARGAAIFAGPEGAVAISGDTEMLMRARWAAQTYAQLRKSRSAQVAATWARRSLGDDRDVTIVVIDRHHYAMTTTTPVAWARRSAEGTKTGMPAGAKEDTVPPGGATP